MPGRFDCFLRGQGVIAPTSWKLAGKVSQPRARLTPSASSKGIFGRIPVRARASRILYVQEGPIIKAPCSKIVAFRVDWDGLVLLLGHP